MHRRMGYIMNKDSIQAYSKRIAQANRSELVVITYEIIIENIKIAQESFLDKQEFAGALEKAQNFLKELMVSLDFEYKISYELMSLYIFVNKMLIESKQKDSIENLPRIQKIMEDLLSSFQEVSRQDNSAPLMQNAQKVYAGLTYGRNDVNETAFVGNEENRGFRA